MIPYPRGLAGHSDADALAHAIIDAVLGAAGRGDIGTQFPPTDDRYRDADSLQLLAAVRDMVRAQGLRPVQVDAVVLAEEPPLGPHVPAMRERLAAALGVAAERVGVKATTTEGMGAIGRAEGIAAQAVALLADDDGARDT